MKLIRRAHSPSLLVAAVLLLAAATRAQTNFFPILQCKNRTYTNATIESVTPATATVFWDGGGERIAITNLPPELLARYHYDPENAQKYIDAQNAKKAAQKARSDEEYAAIVQAQRTLGDAQPVRIVNIISDYHLKIEAQGKASDAYIHNLPPSVLAAFRNLSQIKAQAAGLETQVTQDQKMAAQPIPSAATGSTRAERAAARAQKNAANAGATETAAAVAKVKAQIQELEARTTFLARPSEFINSDGARLWEYQGGAAASLTEKQ